MAQPFGELPVDLLSRFALVLAIGAAVVVLARTRTLAAWRATLTDRFVYGVPWGTALVVAGLLFVYFVIQGAWDHPFDPLVLPFRSWSYFYPEGMLVAPFGHNGRGHLVGNLVATLTLAPIAEYAWGHYPRSGRRSGVFARPSGRIAAVVLAVFGMGLVTSLFVPGPLIGFSGVVFAFAGVGLVTYPIRTVLAVLGARVLSLTYNSWLDPVTFAEAQQRFISPGWAGIAVHGHALGVLVGILVGLRLRREFDTGPSLSHIWLAGVMFGVAEGLYTFFWAVGPSRYAMFRGVGLAAVVVFATLVTLVLADGDRPLVPRHWAPGPLGRLDRVSRSRAALAVVVAPILVLAAVAVPFNTLAIDAPAVDDGVRIGDYRVTYAENVPDQSVSGVAVPFYDPGIRVERSGVIVVNAQRNIWEEVISKGGLAFRGQGRVTVGGLGWRETVQVNRTTWTVVDGGETYTVYVRRPDQPRRQVYIDDPVVVPAVLDGKRVRINPTQQGYQLQVAANQSVVATGPMPTARRNVTLADLTFERVGMDLIARYDRTRITIANLRLRERGN